MANLALLLSAANRQRQAAIRDLNTDLYTMEHQMIPTLVKPIRPSTGRQAILAKQRGFSLIELIAVVAILGILAAVVAPKIFNQPGKARMAKAKTEISNIQSALQMYKLENFNYPSTDQGLQALVEQPTGDPEAPNWQEGGYLDRLPKDPWSRDYLYVSPGENGDIDIYTLGRDGQTGGEGEDADIGNWQS